MRPSAPPARSLALAVFMTAWACGGLAGGQDGAEAPLPPAAPSPVPSMRPAAPERPLWTDANMALDHYFDGYGASASPSVPAPAWSMPVVGPPVTPFERRQTDELYNRVLDLDPNGQNRGTIERVRAATEKTVVGTDTTGEEWITLKDPKRISWGGMIQGDMVTWANDREFQGQPNYFEFRRLRLQATGKGYGVFEYALEVEFAPETDLEAEVVNNRVDLGGFGVELKDAYITIRDNAYLGDVRIGHVKVPSGLAELTGPHDKTFLERPLPHIFVPGREVGVLSNNRTEDQNFTWAYGAFLYDMNEQTHSIVGDSFGSRLATRVTWLPYYDEATMGRYLMHFGASYVYNRPREVTSPIFADYRPVEFSARPEIHRGSNLVDTGDINTVQYHILGGEWAWKQGPLRVESELIYTRLDQPGGASTDLGGAYVYGSYFLTGEQRAYDRIEGVFATVTPLENFWMVRTPNGVATGWGAWELAARWSYLDFASVAGQQLQDLALGVNWYWNPYTRLMFNWIHPFAHRSPASPLVNAEGDIFGTRFEIAF